MSGAEEATPALEAALAHYDSLRGQTVEVPEWGPTGTPLVVHYDPITAAQAAKVRKRAGNSESRLTALTVILFARDASGKPLFSDDAQALAALEGKVDPRVTSRIAQAILGGAQEPEGDDSLGN